jgi:hypothetical protein
MLSQPLRPSPHLDFLISLCGGGCTDSVNDPLRIYTKGQDQLPVLVRAVVTIKLTHYLPVRLLSRELTEIGVILPSTVLPAKDRKPPDSADPGCPGGGRLRGIT